MAPVSDIARLNKVRLTHQQIADMMLSEDRARRRALEDGNAERAAEHDAEIAKLEELLDHAS